MSHNPTIIACIHEMYKFFHFQKLKSAIFVVWFEPPTILFKIWKKTTDKIIPLYAYRVGTGSNPSHLYSSVISDALAILLASESMCFCQNVSTRKEKLLSLAAAAITWPILRVIQYGVLTPGKQAAKITASLPPNDTGSLNTWTPEFYRRECWVSWTMRRLSSGIPPVQTNAMRSPADGLRVPWPKSVLSLPSETLLDTRVLKVNNPLGAKSSAREP